MFGAPRPCDYISCPSGPGSVERIFDGAFVDGVRGYGVLPRSLPSYRDRYGGDDVPRPGLLPVAAIPEEFQVLLYINPLTLIIEQMREVLIGGNWPDWSALAIYTLASLGFGGLGYWCFNRMKQGFADAL